MGLVTGLEEQHKYGHKQHETSDSRIIKSLSSMAAVTHVLHPAGHAASTVSKRFNCAIETLITSFVVETIIDKLMTD
jgi:hypothetical protein